MNKKEVMSPKEAAEYLGISKVTLYKLLKNGEIPGRRLGYQWRISVNVKEFSQYRGKEISHCPGKDISHLFGKQISHFLKE